MCDGILIRNPNGEDLCIPIIVDVERRPGPDPGPLRELFEDIATLVTINQRVAGIANENVRGQLTQSIQQAAQAISQQLPEGVTLGDRLLSASSKASSR